jgi:hypothetical protein
MILLFLNGLHNPAQNASQLGLSCQESQRCWLVFAKAIISWIQLSP